MPVITRARQLGGAGWKSAEVRRILAEEFPDHSPTLTTVTRWIDGDYAERQRECVRRGRCRMAKHWGWRRRLQRLRELREAGLRFPEIVKVARLDFGVDLEARQVESLVRGDASEAFARSALKCPRPSEARS
jgi:hypothetical protein